MLMYRRRGFQLTLIILSACNTVSSEPALRQCYWCGPLAEQVHRSERPHPCDSTGTQKTVCDPDHPHCAIVATYPPYEESRICTKLYQDECYNVFCNTTQIWKMICPCKGDMCNEELTERENKAFHYLRTELANNKKIIKRMVSNEPVDNDPNKSVIDNVKDSIEEINHPIADVKNISMELEHHEDKTTASIDTKLTEPIQPIVTTSTVEITSSTNKIMETTKASMNINAAEPLTVESLQDNVTPSMKTVNVVEKDDTTPTQATITETTPHSKKMKNMSLKISRDPLLCLIQSFICIALVGDILL